MGKWPHIFPLSTLNTDPLIGSNKEKIVSLSERKKELRYRRKRREKLTRMKAKLPNIDNATKAVWAEKLRKMTPGAEVLIKEWGLE